MQIVIKVVLNDCMSLLVIQPVAPERIGKRAGGKSAGHRSGAKCRKNFLVVLLHFVGLKLQLVVLVSAFVMVSTVWSVSCLLFLYAHRAPRALPFVKVGDTCPRSCGVGATANSQFSRSRRFDLHSRAVRSHGSAEQVRSPQQF